MNNELIKRMTKSFVQKDEREFFAAVRQLISSERRQGHGRLADDLSKILSNGTAHPASTASVVSPLARRENTTLVDVRHPGGRLDQIVLDEKTKSQITRFLAEYSHRNELANAGLRPQLKLLFFGPPGNGKTFCAELLAAELNLPLFYVRFDSLITAYLGETAANLRKVFDFATTHHGVLFFDEFDAIGKSRDDHEEVGELKRVVNSFLQLLDGYAGMSPIIAATNYEKLLDYALWRRFDAVVYFPPASREQLKRYLQLRKASVESVDFDAGQAAATSEGLSYAEVDRAFTDALKTTILTRQKSLRLATFEAEVRRVKEARRLRSSLPHKQA